MYELPFDESGIFLCGALVSLIPLPPIFAWNNPSRSNHVSSDPRETLSHTYMSGPFLAEWLRSFLGPHTGIMRQVCFVIVVLPPVGKCKFLLKPASDSCDVRHKAHEQSTVLNVSLG